MMQSVQKRERHAGSIGHNLTVLHTPAQMPVGRT